MVENVADFKTGNGPGQSIINIVNDFFVPSSWRLNRSFHWGFQKPFSVGWWAESDGTYYVGADGGVQHTIRGDLFRVAEWYGGELAKPGRGVKMGTEGIAADIIAREAVMFPSRVVSPGPADRSIFHTSNDGQGVATAMSKAGVDWEKDNHVINARAEGRAVMRKMFTNSRRGSDGEPRKSPGLFIFAGCEQFIRTVPKGLGGEKNLDDPGISIEDCIADEARYRVLAHNDSNRSS